MDPLPPGPTRELNVEWRAVGLKCRLRPSGLPEPVLDVLAEATFLWLFGSSLAMIGAVGIGLLRVLMFEPMEQPLALAGVASASILAIVAVRALLRWVCGQLRWEVDLDGATLTAERYLGPLRLQQCRWPLEEVRATTWSVQGLGVLAGQRRLLLRAHEHPADLRWLAAAIQRARCARADFWRQVLARPSDRDALMRLVGRAAS